MLQHIQLRERNDANQQPLQTASLITMAMEYRQQLEYVNTIQERTADASAFVESMKLLRDVHKQLPIDERGMPTLVTDPAAARQRLLLAACQACRAYYLCSTAPVADCDYGEALQAYMEVFGAPWAAAANTWSASGGPSAVGTADNGGCELGSVLFLFTTGRGPQVYEAAQRALQAAAMLEDATCHTAVGAQLMELVGSQPKPRTGGRPPLLTTQQLQAACCRHAAEVVYAAATLHRRPAMRPAGFTPLKPEQLAEVLAGQEQCAKQLLLRLEPEAPLSHVVAAMALRSRGQEATADAELAAHYLTAVQLAQAAGRDFLQVKAAADALGAAFLSCSRRGDAASAARLEAALTAFEQAEPVLRRSRKYLPEAWTRQMAEALSFAGQQVAPSRSLVQFARQEAGSGSRSSSNSSVARLDAAAAAPSAAALDKSQGTLVPGSQENADPAQASKCDGCGQASANLQRCARCKVAQYCR